MTTIISPPVTTEEEDLDLKAQPLDEFLDPDQAAQLLGCSYDKIVVACKAYRERTQKLWEDHPTIHSYPYPTQTELACYWEYFGQRLGRYLVYKPLVSSLKMNTEDSPTNTRHTGRRVGWTKENNYGKPDAPRPKPHPGLPHSWITKTNPETGEEYRECPYCLGIRRVPPIRQKKPVQS